MYAEITYTSAKGLISATTGATPFYTNDTNPRNTTLNKDDCENITFYVNATGTSGSTYVFYAFANLTSNMTISNSTSTWNVTITNLPNIDWISPTNANGTLAVNQTYITWNISVNDNVWLAKIQINGTNQTATCVNATTSSYCYYNETSGLTGNVTRCAVAWASNGTTSWNRTAATTICRSTNEQQPDTVPPQLEWTSPAANNSQLSANQTYIVWNFSSNEAMGTNGCKVEINGTNQTGILNGSSTGCTYNETTLTGNQTRCAYGWANDSSNNWNRTAYRCASTNEQQPTNPPNVDWISPTNANGTESANKTYITWNITVNSNVWLAKIQINGTNQTATCVNATTNSYCYYNETTGLAGNVTRCAVGWASNGTTSWNRTAATTICRSTSEQFNAPPDTAVMVLNSTSGTNYTNEDMLCWARPYYTAAGSLTAYYQWWKNDTLNRTGQKAGVTNGTINLIANLTDSNTTKHEEWKCVVKMGDEVVNESEWNNATLYIRNSVPTISLYLPEDNNMTINRTPMLSWNASDPDNDSLSYTVNIGCLDSCSDDNRTVFSASSSYIPTMLKYFGDDNHYYLWSAKADDGEVNSSYTAERNVTIQSDVTLSLPTDSVNFNPINLDMSYDTTGGSPAPFVIQNDGNCMVDVNISASAMLWVMHPEVSSFFQYKVDNVTSEPSSFNWSGSATSWGNMPLATTKAILYLNFSNANDSAEVDINITVPSDEPSGSKGSQLTFIGKYVGG